jgi:hypothetical protein
MIYVPPDDDYLRTLSPEDWADVWAHADDHGAYLTPRTSSDYISLWGRHPERIACYRPRAEMIAYLRLPESWGVPAEPLTEREQERFILTMASDDRFRRAMLAALAMQGGVA